MAEKDQPPTPRRLREARKRGQIVFSSDVSSGLAFVVATVALWALGGAAFAMIRELWRHATSGELFARPGAGLQSLMLHAGEVLLWGTLAPMAIAAVAAFAGSFVQVGGLVAWERIKPDLARLNPAEGFERIVSTRNLINLAKMLLKTLLLAVLMFVVIRSFIDTALKVGHGSPSGVMQVGAVALMSIFGWAAVIYAAMAAIDYVHQRYEFMKDQRMSIEDVRREYKEAEGDPINQSRRRQAHFEAVYASLIDRVRASSAVIHSPRVAIALQYLGEHDLPRVIARGEGDVASQIRRIAGEALIPMEFEPQLAERLYAEVPEDQAIPRALYAPVATLLRWAQGNDG